jgi:hypothetical protein
MHSGTTYCNKKNSAFVLPTQCVFRMTLAINSDYLPRRFSTHYIQLPFLLTENTPRLENKEQPVNDVYRRELPFIMTRNTYCVDIRQSFVILKTAAHIATTVP